MVADVGGLTIETVWGMCMNGSCMMISGQCGRVM